jgi:hypothetical protein
LMKPYPFESLNHLTVPFIPLPPTTSEYRAALGAAPFPP